jgi:hypothetical protein
LTASVHKLKVLQCTSAIDKTSIDRIIVQRKKIIEYFAEFDLKNTLFIYLIVLIQWLAMFLVFA